MVICNMRFGVLLSLLWMLGCGDTEEPLGPPEDAGTPDLQLSDASVDAADGDANLVDAQVIEDATVDLPADMTIMDMALDTDQSVDATEVDATDLDTADARMCVDLSGTYSSSYMRCTGSTPSSFTLTENQPCEFSSLEDDQLVISTGPGLSATRGADCTINFDDAAARLTIVCGFGASRCQITAVRQ